MQIILVGLSYKTAPISIRERLAFRPDEATAALERLISKFGDRDAEFAILSTCNRTELYCTAGKQAGPSLEEIIQEIADIRAIASSEFREYLYVKFGEDAVNHLLTVSSSLDSMVVGEPQIVGQVKESYTVACNAKSTGKILNKLFHCAFTTSKLIYSSTLITSRRVSVAGVAVELARQLFVDISSAKILVIGVGDMGQILVERFCDLGCGDVTVVNRTHSRGLELAEKLNIRSAKWEELDEQLAKANIVVSSIAAPQYLFNKDSLKNTMRKRTAGPLLIIDIGVPRCFDPEIEKLDNLYLYSIDDLAQVAERNFKLREGEIDQAVEIISQKKAEFMEWFGSRELGPIIGQMKELFEQISKKEMEGFFVGVRHDAHCREEVGAMLTKIVNRFMHCIIGNVKETAKERGVAEAMKLAIYMVNQAEQVADTANRRQEE
jgi:glutamyl-tRNA reductase